MKTICSVIFPLLLSAGSSQAVANHTDPKAVLSQTLRVLQSAGSLQYKSEREIHYYGENYHAGNQELVYLSFPFRNEPEQFRFQSHNETYKAVYNGMHYFLLDEKKKTIDITRKNVEERIGSASALYNSLLSIRNFIPLLLKKEGISIHCADSLINNKVYTVLRFSLMNEYISNLGNITPFTKEYTGDPEKPYELLIDKENFLPCRFSTFFKGRGREKDHITVTYTGIRIDPPAPDINSWYYSTYTKQYQPPVPAQPLVAAGSYLPGFTLPQFLPTETKTLTPAKGKPLLIEFWIKNCGYCMQAFPLMNELRKQWDSGRLDIISVNTEDQLSNIAFFFNKHRPAYPMLYNGIKLAESLGVNAYPTIILVDKTGKIQYAGSLNREKIEQEINKLINR